MPSEEEAEEELGHGQVLRPAAPGGAAHSAQATVETLYAQAMVRTAQDLVYCARLLTEQCGVVGFFFGVSGK